MKPPQSWVNFADAADAAAKLRAHPELVDDLDYHFAAVAVALNTAAGGNSQLSALLPEIDRHVGR